MEGFHLYTFLRVLLSYTLWRVLHKKKSKWFSTHKGFWRILPSWSSWGIFIQISNGCFFTYVISGVMFTYISSGWFPVTTLVASNISCKLWHWKSHWLQCRVQECHDTSPPEKVRSYGFQELTCLIMLCGIIQKLFVLKCFGSFPYTN